MGKGTTTRICPSIRRANGVNWLDLEKRGEHLGKCTADFRPFSDGECHICMFYVDEKCPYLIRKEGDAKDG